MEQISFFLFDTQAIQLDPEFSRNIGQIVVLGGAFAVNGNVNPAAEANVSCKLCAGRSSLDL